MTYLRKRRSEIRTIKWQQTHNFWQPNLKKQKQNKLSKQLEQEQIHRNRDYMEGYQQGGGRGERCVCGGKVQGIMVSTKETGGG